MAKQTTYNVGIYVRLSQEDERAGESLSIENQKKMLTEYVSKQEGWNLIEICEDDGYSGTSFDRPGIKQILDDAKSGKINLILCKDLSRFGRNYIEVGQYIDYIFPSFNIRFIALSDNVDTLDRNSSAMDLMPVMNLFNEWHAANTSKKVRSVMAANSRQGKDLGGSASYGYIKADDEKHTPLIDEDAAVIVRRIFEQRARGLSPKQIAIQLNKDGIATPSDHRYQLKGKDNPLVTSHLWNDCMVRGILNNEIYIGNLAQQRVTTVSYKNHKQIRKDRSEWIVIENNHEPIISRELWDKVREVDASVSIGKTTKEGVILPLSGFMYCPDCGYKMKMNRTMHTSKKRGTYETVSYRCGTYVRSGMDGCTPHSILERVISQIVVDDIRAKARLAVEDEDALREAVRKRRQATADAESQHNSKELHEGEKRLAQLETLISKTYEEKLLGTVPEELCVKMLNQYLDEQKMLREKVAVLKEKCETAEQAEKDIDRYIENIKKYVDIQELTRETCLELIEYIVIGDRPESKDEDRQIHIFYKFLDKGLTEKRNILLPQNVE